MDKNEIIKISFGIFKYEAENPTIKGVAIVILVLLFIVIMYKSFRKNVKPGKAN